MHYNRDSSEQGDTNVEGIYGRNHRCVDRCFGDVGQHGQQPQQQGRRA